MEKSVSEMNRKWAISREETARVREGNAIAWMLSTYCDFETSPDVDSVIEEFRKATKPQP